MAKCVISPVWNKLSYIFSSSLNTLPLRKIFCWSRILLPLLPLILLGLNFSLWYHTGFRGQVSNPSPLNLPILPFWCDAQFILLYKAYFWFLILVPACTLKHGCPFLLSSCQSWAHTTNSSQWRQKKGSYQEKTDKQRDTASPALNSHQPQLIPMCTRPTFQQRGNLSQ